MIQCFFSWDSHYLNPNCLGILFPGAKNHLRPPDSEDRNMQQQHSVGSGLRRGSFPGVFPSHRGRAGLSVSSLTPSSSLLSGSCQGILHPTHHHRLGTPGSPLLHPGHRTACKPKDTAALWKWTFCTTKTMATPKHPASSSHSQPQGPPQMPKTGLPSSFSKLRKNCV